ncbi:MAG: hypothetical protein E7554_09725 [Ruminococcaceae bacterium]|nr:hypothetical protein [Oscillospiraceae bacterium]
MLCQYCGTPLAPGSTECTICGSQSSALYSGSSGQSSYGSSSYSSQSTQQYGTQSDSYDSQSDYAAPTTQVYTPSGSYSSQSDYSQQYGMQSYSQPDSYSAQSYSQSAGYGAQSYSQPASYGAQNSYSMQQYGAQNGYSMQQYGAQNGYGYTPQQYGAQQGYSNAYAANNAYYQQNAAAYGSSAYGRSSAGGNATSVASSTIRSLTVSPLFIIAISLACISMLLGISISHSNGEILESSSSHYVEGDYGLEFFEVLVDIAEDPDDIVDLLEDLLVSVIPTFFAGLCSIGDLINTLPYILMIIGFWVALGSMASKRSVPFGTGGFTCIKVGLVFRTVLSCITGSIIMIILAISLIAGASVLSDYGGDYAAAGFGVLFAMFALFVTYFVLRCIYYSKQTRSLNIARTTAAQGVFNINMSMYVIVCNFILAAFHLYTAIYYIDVPLLLIRHLANCASLIMMSISMIMYRNKIDYVRGYSVPVHMS